MQASDFPTGSAGALGNTVDVVFDKINFAYQTLLQVILGVLTGGSMPEMIEIEQDFQFSVIVMVTFKR